MSDWVKEPNVCEDHNWVGPREDAACPMCYLLAMKPKGNPFLKAAKECDWIKEAAKVEAQKIFPGDSITSGTCRALIEQGFIAGHDHADLPRALDEIGRLINKLRIVTNAAERHRDVAADRLSENQKLIAKNQELVYALERIKDPTPSYGRPDFTTEDLRDIARSVLERE